MQRRQEGGEFGYDEPDLDYNIDHDYNDEEEQEVNRTQPFQLGAASTPYQCGEEIEMQTGKHEQSGRPDISYDEETPLLRRAGSIADLQNESVLRQNS